MTNSVQGAFYGGESTLLASHVYKIYVENGALHLARVADRFSREVLEGGYSAAMGVGGLVAHVGVATRNNLEATYDSLEAGGSDFLGKDKRNFSVCPSSVNRVILKKVTAMTQGPGRVGFVELQGTNGKTRKLTLTGALGSQEVERLLRLVFPSAEGSLS